MYEGENPAGAKAWAYIFASSFSSMAQRPALHITRLRDVAWKFMNYRVAEFILKTLQGMKCIQVKYIQPGRPMQNGYIERLNRTFREDILDAYQFETLEQVRILSDEWQYTYNHKHPHKSLKRKTPDAFRRNLITIE